MRCLLCQTDLTGFPNGLHSCVVEQAIRRIVREELALRPAWVAPTAAPPMVPGGTTYAVSLGAAGCICVPVGAGDGNTFVPNYRCPVHGRADSASGGP